MEFKVGNIKAKCSGCGGTVFEPNPGGASYGRRSRFYCPLCETQTFYTDLVLQIKKEAAKKTKERLIASAGPASQRA